MASLNISHYWHWSSALVSKITVCSFVKKWLLPLGLTSTDSAAGEAIQKKIDISGLHDNMIKYIVYSETMKVALGNERCLFRNVTWKCGY